MVTNRPKDPAKLSVQSRGDDIPWVASPDVTGNIFVQIGMMADELPEWNALYPNRRDRYLKTFMRSDTMLASAIYSMKTRIQTLNYTLNGPPRAKKFALELLQKPGFQDSLIDLSGKWTDDLLTSDNGAFIELWRPGNPMRDAKNAPIVGFASLDSRQAWRSFDPEFPVWYTNPQTGAIRKLHRSRVLMTSDNPQPQELARNIGFCAVSRAWRWAHLMRSVMIYRDEKVTGRFTRAIGAIKGVNAKQVRDGLRATDDEADSKGFVLYRGIPFFISPGTDAAADVDILLQDLASLGDGFEFQSDIQLYAYVLAFALGVDAREFWPATASGATKGDATIQNMKARGRGLGFLIQAFENQIRQCLPDTVEFTFDYTDDEQDEMQARIHKIRLENLAIGVDKGAINPLEMRALMIAEGIIDGMLLEELNIPSTTDSALDGENSDDEALEENSENPADPQDGPQDTEAVTRKALQADKAHTGVMSALFIPPVAAQRIYDFVEPTLTSVGLTTIPPEEYHVTLVYAGDSGAYDDGEQQEIIRGVSEVALDFAPFTARINGLGRFIHDSGDETNALYVSIDAPELPELRQAIYRRMRWNIAIEQIHGFTPHVTVAYIPMVAPTPNIQLSELTFEVSSVILAWGDTRFTFVLNGKQSAASRKSINTYRETLKFYVRALWEGSYGYYDFLNAYQAAIRNGFTEAWNEGAALCGMLPEDRTEAEQTRLNLEILTEFTYITNFAQAIVASSKANGGMLESLYPRVDMWANAYGRILTIGQTLACADKKAVWIEGLTENGCFDCKGYNGRVYRNSVWVKFLQPYDALPKGHGLFCKGYNCQCILDPTSAPVTKGFPPKPVGGFKEHSHGTESTHRSHNPQVNREPAGINASG